MTYVANSIVTVDGKEYRPGDTIQMPADSKALGILVGIGYVIQRLATGDVLLRVSVEVATQGGDFGHTLTFCGAGLFNLRLTLSFGFCFRFRAQGLDLSLKRVKLAGFFLGHVPACSAGGCEDCLLTLHLLLHQCSFVHAVPPVSGFYLP